jgi:cob(I)alamin adenosyltransferase
VVTICRVNLPPKFVLPGGTEPSTGLDVARAAIRPAEPRVVEFKLDSELTDDTILHYLNRASDPGLFEGRK